VDAFQRCDTLRSSGGQTENDTNAQKEKCLAELETVAKSDAPILVRRIGAFLGAEVTGVDLTRPLEPARIEALNAAVATHEVLVFPKGGAIRQFERQ
jgi:hypothetical protein